MILGSTEQNRRLEGVEDELIDSHLLRSRGSRQRHFPTCIARQALTVIDTRPSALPLRRSYKQTVRSLPLLARTLVSLLLKATSTMCSAVDRFDVE